MCCVHGYRTFPQAGHLTTIMCCVHSYHMFPQAGRLITIMCCVHSYCTFPQTGHLTTIMCCVHSYCTLPQAGCLTTIMHRVHSYCTMPQACRLTPIMYCVYSYCMFPQSWLSRHHSALCWLTECTMIRVLFHHPSQCNLPHLIAGDIPCEHHYLLWSLLHNAPIFCSVSNRLGKHVNRYLGFSYRISFVMSWLAKVLGWFAVQSPLLFVLNHCCFSENKIADN